MATLMDIAEAAKVSKATVSYVLNNKKLNHVNELTRQRVLATAKRLNYVKNDIAHAVSTGKTRVIAYFHSQIQPENWYGISSAAEDRNFLIKAFHVGRTDTERLGCYRDICLQQRVAGAIFHHSAENIFELQRMLTDANIPVATTSWSRELPDISVIPDDYLGGGLAAEHLFDMGYRRIVLLGPSGIATDTRFDGFVDFFNKKGIEIPGENIFKHHHHERYKKVMRDVLSNPARRPEAIFCASSAVPLFAVMNELKLSAPDDLAVVDYGNNDNARYYFDITSICEKNFETGRRCARLLIDKIEGRQIKNIHEKYPVELIVRKSTAGRINKNQL